MHKVQSVLKTHQVIVLMLCRMAVYLSCKVITLHLDNSTAKAYLCSQGDTVSLSLSILDFHIFNVANKHGITHIPAYIHMHFNVDADYLLW